MSIVFSLHICLIVLKDFFFLFLTIIEFKERNIFQDEMEVQT